MRTKQPPIRIGYLNSSKNIYYSLMLFGMGAIFGGFVSVFLFINITGGSAQPSQPISAPRLSLESESDMISQAIAPLDETNSSRLIDNESHKAMIDSDNAQNEVIITSEAEVPVEQNTTTLSPRLFRIVSDESEARFSVYETFPEGTAIGRTDQIAGDIIVDFNNPSNSQLGIIRINLRTLQTDDPDRDRSIRCCVLLTAQPKYEFADFVPMSLVGLPSQVELGQTVAFQVTGDLTLRGVTRSVTFDIDLTIVDADVLQGLATTIVNRTDFSILNNGDNGFDYHGVEEEVNLAFEFVARSVPE